MTDAIVVEHLTKRIKTGWRSHRTILDDVSFVVPAGGIFGFVGPNGAGKSTTIRHIIGVSTPTDGAVKLYGVPAKERAARASLGYAAEAPLFPLALTPDELLSTHATLGGLRLTNARRGELWELVGIAGRANDPMSAMSKGMRQRVAIAIALVAEPKLLVVDEPMSGLDPSGRDLIRSILRTVNEAGTTVLFSSHVLSDIESLCSHLGVMRQGKMQWSGPARDLRQPGVRAEHEIEVYAPGGDVTALSAFGSVRAVGSFATVVVGADADALDIAGRIRGMGMVVESIKPLHGSLEKAILALTGRSDG